MGNLHGSFELTLIAVVVLVPVLVGLGVLFALPRSLRELSRRNAYRFDGSFSQKRCILEWRELLRVIGQLMGLPILIVLPLTLGACLFHQSMIPAGEGWAALETLVSDPEHAVEGMRKFRNEKVRQAEWEGRSPDVTLAKLEWLWDGWPFILAAGMAGIGMSLLLVRRVNAATIRKYHQEVVERHREYQSLDLSRLVEIQETIPSESNAPFNDTS